MEKIKKITNTKKPKKAPSFFVRKYFTNDINEYNNLDKKPILFVRNLTKRYPLKKAPAINNLNFNVYPGEFHAFIGGNGAGKTTTIKSLIGAYSNFNGTILIDGHKNNTKEAKKAIGYIPETARFPDNFSAFEYIKWMTILSGISHKDAKIYAEQRLKDLNMWNLKNKSPNSFSSGQKKKILLAQALVHNPKIIIMDEPTANLDPKASLEFFETLHKLRSSGVAIFISSHILSELDAFSDSVTILDGGKIVFDGSKKELMEKHIQPKYLCSSSDDAKILTYLENKKIEKYIQNDGIIILFNDSKQINEFQKEAIEKNIYFNTFKKIEPSLYDIYDKLIVKGSVDTMKK